MTEAVNHRILLVDDTASIHEDFKKVLQKSDVAGAAVDDAMAALLGAGAPADARPAAVETLSFELDSAMQGKDAADLVKLARDSGRPYALAFVDIRMPPGWDGIRTIEAIWELDKEIQTVICTAYSDYSWDQMVQRLGRSDRLLVLKKPFDPVEITQLASALTEKWSIARRESALIEKLKRAEAEARAYAASLETVNHALITAKAATDKLTEMKTEFLLRLSDEVNHKVESILGNAVQLRNLDNVKPGVDDGIATIIAASERLMLTFHETLDIAMLETGRDANKLARVDPAVLLREVVQEDQAGARKKGLDIVLELADDLPATIEIGSRRMRQVLDELLQSAVVHTERGSLRLSCRMQFTHDWKHPRMRIEIGGIGQGFREEDRGRIFDLFARAQKGNDMTSSPGIGLALAKRIADAMGWDVTLETLADGTRALVLALDIGDASSAPVAAALHTASSR